MAHDRSGVVRYAAQVIRANKLSAAELELQLDSLWKTGYQAGRKAAIKARLVEKGVASLRRMREEARSNIAIDSNRHDKSRTEPTD
jgi:hypothetical protein